MRRPHARERERERAGGETLLPLALPKESERELPSKQASKRERAGIGSSGDLELVSRSLHSARQKRVGHRSEELRTLARERERERVRKARGFLPGPSPGERKSQRVGGKSPVAGDGAGQSCHMQRTERWLQLDLKGRRRWSLTCMGACRTCTGSFYQASAEYERLRLYMRPTRIREIPSLFLRRLHCTCHLWRRLGRLERALPPCQASHSLAGATNPSTSGAGACPRRELTGSLGV